MRRRRKYGNRKVEADGQIFDSAREYRRWLDLDAMQDAGLIDDLRRQVKYILIPEQRQISTELYTRGPKKGTLKPGRVLERECFYIADFVYTDIATGEEIVEDTKGVRTKDYIIKRKLMLKEYGIQIHEV